jgi:hypothetical protein
MQQEETRSVLQPLAETNPVIAQNILWHIMQLRVISIIEFIGKLSFSCKALGAILLYDPQFRILLCEAFVARLRYAEHFPDFAMCSEDFRCIEKDEFGDDTTVSDPDHDCWLCNSRSDELEFRYWMRQMPRLEYVTPTRLKLFSYVERKSPDDPTLCSLCWKRRSKRKRGESSLCFRCLSE